jgi:uncharacterized protein YndB with AHSA1/START domain
VREVKVSTVISASCEDVFDVLEDLSQRPAFSDHYLKDFRLSRANPRGTGATARFLFARRIFAERAEIRILECERPHRIVEEGSVGRLGRSSLSAVYELQPEASGCRVELTTSSEPKTAVDRLRQRGARRWIHRNTKKALTRLRKLLEDPGSGPSERVTVAGYEPHTAPRFGDHVRGPQKTAAADG